MIIMQMNFMQIKPPWSIESLGYTI